MFSPQSLLNAHTLFTKFNSKFYGEDTSLSVHGNKRYASNVQPLSFVHTEKADLQPQICDNRSSIWQATNFEGIQFSVCEWVDGEIRGRHSPYLGHVNPFGPFLNEQRGLWN